MAVTIRPYRKKDHWRVDKGFRRRPDLFLLKCRWSSQKRNRVKSVLWWGSFGLTLALALVLLLLLVLLFGLSLASSWTLSKSQSRNSRASCWEFPRNWEAYLATVLWGEGRHQHSSLGVFKNHEILMSSLTKRGRSYHIELIIWKSAASAHLARLFLLCLLWTHLRTAVRFVLALIILCNSFMILFRGSLNSLKKKKWNIWSFLPA